MNTRKAAVVGSNQGPWVPTGALKGLGLEVIGDANTLVETELKSGDHSTSLMTIGPGVHKLEDCEWSRSKVLIGVSTLCFLVSGV